ncbi:EcoAI/FtnUII family type I restriction enzme subunit R [Kiloniella majae]|uniref:EcoAI/FtnUII family type I restriction enzme subunit R n=1 Tax=Kiloniella majae TaxID=1938558 RepID=UPI000A276F84|nr:DEAD/DEAH box helicase family protein [Kiloniella majae]
MSRNEAQTRLDLIDPALLAAGWSVVEGSCISVEHTITQGRLVGGGRRAQPLAADYVLIYRNKKLAVIEAKAEKYPVSEGRPQAVEYAERLQVRFAYSTNGKGLYEIDTKTGKEIELSSMGAVPSPQTLWNRIYHVENYWRDRFAEVAFEDRGGTWQPRYYQDNAIERTLDAVASGKDRILLTLATGTGKTAIAFQLAWKLFQSRWNLTREPTRRPRILFLADRNILADQAFNSFSAFAEDALVRIAPDEVRKKGRVPKNANIFFTIFQTFMSGPDGTPYFGDYPEDFFDFIIIDECHRGGAKDESAWRDILEYFEPAVQLGLTATPKRKGNVDTYSYFGRPVYEYSLKEGINDGFLTPFRVRQITTTMDDYVFTPGDTVLEGADIIEEGKRYREQDFNKSGGIVIKEREAKRVEIFMDEANQQEKAIVFCKGQPHAALIRDLINQVKESSDLHYCERVGADDGARGEAFLRAFQDNEKTVPTVLTSSTKLSTGVDARNVRNVVLMRPVQSMIEFKQIVGRGTRLFDDKDYFTIYDFCKNYEMFEDPEWDGEPLDPADAPVRSPKPDKDGEPTGMEDEPGGYDPGEPEEKQTILIKLADGSARRIQHMAATSFWGPDGKPVSSAQFVNKLFGELPELFRDEDELRMLWGKPDTRKALIQGLEERGYGEAVLSEVAKLIDAQKSDLFDVLAYIAFAMDPITRTERVDTHKDTILRNYDDKLQAFLEFVLGQYEEQGVQELDQAKLPSLLELKYNSTGDAAIELGGIPRIRDAFVGFQRHLY